MLYSTFISRLVLCEAHETITFDYDSDYAREGLSFDEGWYK